MRGDVQRCHRVCKEVAGMLGCIKSFEVTRDGFDKGQGASDGIGG